MRKKGAVEHVVAAKPDVFNHNLKRCHGFILRSVRAHVTSLLSNCWPRVKDLAPPIFTKSGIMVGLGETREEIFQFMDDLRAANVDFLTIGQYLQPTSKHAAVHRFVTPDEFASYATVAKGKGFLTVSASPLTRSSYHAGDDFRRLRAAREAKLAT